MLIPLQSEADAKVGAMSIDGLAGHAWVLWQLADSAFPTGGFAHSAGLEAAYHHGEVRDRRQLGSFLEASLQQTGASTVPWAVAGHREPERLREWDQRCDAATSNHVANRASRLQGRAFLASCVRIYGLSLSRPPAGHFAPLFGCVCRHLELDVTTMARLLLFNHARSVLASAVRLGIVGPMEAQATQFQLIRSCDPIIERSIVLSVDQVAVTSPLIELWQGNQDQLYSRLFQS